MMLDTTTIVSAPKQGENFHAWRRYFNFRNMWYIMKAMILLGPNRNKKTLSTIKWSPLGVIGHLTYIEVFHM